MVISHANSKLSFLIKRQSRKQPPYFKSIFQKNPYRQCSLKRPCQVDSEKTKISSVYSMGIISPHPRKGLFDFIHLPLSGKRFFFFIYFAYPFGWFLCHFHAEEMISRRSPNCGFQPNTLRALSLDAISCAGSPARRGSILAGIG